MERLLNSKGAVKKHSPFNYEKNAKVARIVLSYKPYIKNSIIRKATKEEQMLWLKKD